MPARWAVGTDAGRVQRIDPDQRGAPAGGKLHEAQQIAEVADTPVALRAQPVELYGEAPNARALFELRRLVAALLRQLASGNGRGGSQGLQKGVTRLRRDRAGFPPDVHVAVGDLGQASIQRTDHGCPGDPW